jgi:hypothetical protein
MKSDLKNQDKIAVHLKKTESSEPPAALASWAVKISCVSQSFILVPWINYISVDWEAG